MGDDYGPKLASREPMGLEELKRPDMVLAVSGQRTSAFAATSLMLGEGERKTAFPASPPWDRSPASAVRPSQSFLRHAPSTTVSQTVRQGARLHALHGGDGRGHMTFRPHRKRPAV
jgi:hypothetical protein